MSNHAIKRAITVALAVSIPGVVSAETTLRPLELSAATVRAARATGVAARRQAPGDTRPVPAPLDAPAVKLAFPYEVDPGGDPSATTTVFSLSSVLLDDVDVTIKYVDNLGQVTFSAPDAVPGLGVLPLNLRDVRNSHPEVPPVGGVVVDAAEPIFGNFYVIDAAGGRATGELALNVDPLDPFTDLCQFFSARVLNGGPFAGGTELQIYLPTPLGAGPSDPSSFFILFWPESGGEDPITVVGVATDQVFVRIPFAELVEFFPAQYQSSFFGRAEVWGNGPGVGTSFGEETDPESVVFLAGTTSLNAGATYNLGEKMGCVDLILLF
jgi:hypothetical protein